MKREELIEAIMLGREKLARESRKSFPAFAAMRQPMDMQPALHHMVICHALDALEKGEIPGNRVMLMLPPGSAKSSYGSRLFPQFFLGRNPQLSCILASHTAELAESWGRKVRNGIAEQEFAEIFPNVGVACDNASAGRWATNQGGEFFSAGVGGSITGRRADCVVGNTMVMTCNGQKRIDEITNEDYVLSYSENECGPVYRRVVAVARRRASETFRVHTELGGLVEATGDHRIYCGTDWKEAKAIVAGDVLMRVLSFWQTQADPVSLVERVRHQTGIFVYDIEVEETHNFFANGVLVHNCGIIDDPVASREDADSERVRQKTWEWYTNDFLTRLKPGAKQVLIMTRWHEDDLAGRLLERERSKWKVIKIPMIAGPNDPLDREEGERLWAEWFTDEMVEVAQADPRSWISLYQQEPRPAEGAEFKRTWIQRYASPPKMMNKIILVDPAGDPAKNSGKRKKSDFTAMWVIGLGSDENAYVLDGLRDRLNLTQRADALFALHKKHKPMQVRYEQYGLQADVEHVKSEMERRQYRFAIKEVGGGVEKNARIRRLIPWFESGRVWLPPEMRRQTIQGVDYDVVSDFIEQEYATFPVGRYDDSFDCLARLAEPNLTLPYPDEDDAGDLRMAVWDTLDQTTGY